jgi:hypothetical protein
VTTKIAGKSAIQERKLIFAYAPTIKSATVKSTPMVADNISRDHILIVV